MPQPLSKMERRILDYLIDYLRQNTYQPSIREIGKRFGIKSTKTVSEYLQSLADKGHIEREASRSRAVRIIGLELQNADAIKIPFYGKIVPDHKLAASPGTFFLEVHGQSMEGIGILNGDLVLVEPTGDAGIRNGEIVAARLDRETTVKRYFQRDGGVVLESAHPDHAPVPIDDHDDFAILGRVNGLFRRFTLPQTEPIGG